MTLSATTNIIHATQKFPEDTRPMSLNDDQRRLILNHADRLLNTRAWPKTICPSEIARALSGSELDTLNATTWRDAMDTIRQLLWEKRASGEVEVMQKGEVVVAESLEDIRGPIRVRVVKTQFSQV